MDKQFAVLGLGSFGSSVALTLENMGCDVLVVDESYEKVQEISDKVSYAVKADVSEPDVLQALGGRNLDGVVVAISESLEASIMATMLCKEMGIPLVVAKAKDKLQGAILQRVGADRIVYPEIEMGSRVAKSLVSKEFVESEIWKEKSGSLPTMGASIHSEEMETVMFMQIVSTAQKWSVRNWNMAKWKNCNRLCAV